MGRLVGQGVAARPADCLVPLPLYHQQHSVAALTTEEAINNSAGVQPAVAKPWNRRDQTALRLPPLEPVVQRLAQAADGRGVLPAAAGHQHMHDAADHPAIIDPRFSACVRWQVRLKSRELLLGQLVTSLSPQPSPFRVDELDFGPAGNPFYGSQP